MLKILLKIIVGVILTLIVLIAGAAIYYQFDEDLSPDVIKVLNYKPEVIKDKKNGYYHLLGLYAEKDSNPVTHGVEIIQKAKEKYQIDNEIAILSTPDLENINEIVISADHKHLCYANDGVCLDMVKKNYDAIASILKNNALIIQRFSQAYHFTDFQETPFLFGFEGLPKAHRLALTDIAFKWLNGDKKAALDLLNQDLEFWRMVTRSEISLITRMIAVSLIGRNLKLWSEIVTDCGGCRLIDEKMISIKQHLMTSELSLRKVFGIEYRYMYALLENAIDDELKNSFMNKVGSELFFFKKNSMLNKIHLVHENLIELSECDISQYLECDDTYKNKILDKPDYTSWEFIDDPVGTILAAISMPAYTGYAKVYFEIEAKRRLILAKHIIYKNELKPSEIQTYLDELTTDLRNPFDGSAIKSNADDKSLLIISGKDNQVNVSIKL